MVVGETTDSSRAVYDRAARVALGIAPDATRDDIQRAFFRDLVERSYVPDPAIQDAFLFLIGQKVAPGSEFLAAARKDATRRLDREVFDFGGTMFVLDPSDRRAAWNKLRDSCSDFPPVLRYLSQLSPGLDIDARAIDTLPADVQALARGILASFALDWPYREANRQKFLAELIKEDPSGGKKLRQAIRTLRKASPEIAALDPVLLDQLAAYSSRSFPAKARVKKPKTSNSWWSRHPRLAVILFLAVVGGQLSQLSRSTSTPSSTSPAFNVGSAEPSLSSNELVRRVLAVRQIVENEKINASPSDIQSIMTRLPVRTSPDVAGKLVKDPLMFSAEARAVFKSELDARNIVVSSEQLTRLLDEVYPLPGMLVPQYMIPLVPKALNKAEQAATQAKKPDGLPQKVAPNSPTNVSQPAGSKP